MFDYDSAIRRVPDFPKKGIMFYDITSVIANPQAVQAIKEDMLRLYRDKPITKIIAVESRGFFLAPLLAEVMRVPIVLARKKGKLPNETYSQEYELEYGTDIIEIQKCDIENHDNFLIVDDLIATGGTLDAICSLIKNNSGARIAGIFAVIGLPFLNYEKVLEGYEINTLINFYSE